MKTSASLAARVQVVLGLILITSASLPRELHANPKIRSAFFGIYTNAVGTKLDDIPSRSGHCGVCHFDFKSGGNPWNPYGQAVRDGMAGLCEHAHLSRLVGCQLQFGPQRKSR